MDEGLISLLSCRPDRDAHAIPVRRPGLQRPAAQLRADVPGAAKPRPGNAASRLSGRVSRNPEAELSTRPAATLPRLVRPAPQAGGCAGRQPLMGRPLEFLVLSLWL